MVINRQSWHYRFQNFVYEYDSGEIERIREPKNLCSYFWMTVSSIFLVGSLGSILTIISCIIAPLFGYYPKKICFPIMPDVEKDGGDLRERQQLFTVKGVRIYGYQLIVLSIVGYLLLIVGYLIYVWVSAIIEVIKSCGIMIYVLLSALMEIIKSYGVYASIVIFTLLALFISGWSIYIFISRARRSDTWQLILGYRQAVKEKVCPLIQYK